MTTAYGYTEAQEKMITKIKNLLALASSTTFPDEAASAVAKAQELLFKYNLTMHDVSLKTDDINPDINEITKDGITLKKGTPDNWQKTLVNGVARYNFCRAVYIPAWRSRGKVYRPAYMEVVGAKHNILIVQYLTTYLQREILNLANRAKTQYEWDNKRFAPNGFITAFCFGAVNTVLDRLADQFNAMRDSAANARALVVTSEQAVEEKLNEYFPYLRSGSSRIQGGGLNGVGYHAGVDAGKAININAGLTGDYQQPSALR